MAQENISTGIKITVDTSELTTKFNKSVEQLNAGLTKAQKALKLTYNESGFLSDALGRCVEGLTQNQIKLGMWVDEQARARTLTGGFAEGLSRIELELGRYADELGNVYNKSGEIVRSLRNVSDGQEQLATKSLQVRAALSECAAGIGDVARQFTEVSGALFDAGIFSEEVCYALQSGFNAVQEVSSDFQFAINMFYSVEEASKSLKNLNNVISGTVKNLANSLGIVSPKLQSVATTAASIAGPATIAATAIGLIGYSVYKYYDAHSVNAQLSESYKELEKRAKESGKAIKDVNDVVRNGAFKSFGTEISEAAKKIDEAAEKFKQAKIAAEEAQRRAAETARYAGMGGVGFVDRTATNAEFAANEAEANYKNAVADFTTLAESAINSWREEQKTEIERLEDARRDAEKIQEFIKSRGASEEALAIANKQILSIDQKIEEAKNAQAKADAESAAAAEEKAKQERLRANGIANYLSKAERASAEIAPTIDAFNETMGKWQESVANGDITQEELEKAIGAYRDDVKAKLFSNVGYSPESVDQAADKYEQLKKALDSSIITQREYDDVLKQLKEKDDLFHK